VCAVSTWLICIVIAAPSMLSQTAGFLRCARCPDRLPTVQLGLLCPGMCCACTPKLERQAHLSRLVVVVHALRPLCCVLLVSAIMWCLMPTTVSNRIFMLLLLFFQAVYRAPRAGPFTLVPTLRRMLGFTRCVPCMCYECCCLRCATGCERLLFAVACWLLPCTLCYVPLYDIADACVVYWCMLWASLAGIAV